MISRKTVNALLVSAVALTVASGVSRAHGDDAAAAETEKCYGVVKAGKNDCASASNSHSCAGAAATDGATDEYVSVPKGLCEKLVNGSPGKPVPAEAPKE